MEEKIDTVILELQKLRDDGKAKSISGFEQILRILEKLVVPIMLGLLAWFGSQAASKISEGQLKLAESAAEDRKVEFRRSMQAKYIEIFYKDLNSGDSRSQSNAIRLMQMVDTDLAKNLLELVAVTPGVSPAVIAQASAVKKEIETTDSLKGYKIGIYFYGDDPSSIPRVLKVRERLKDAGFRGIIQDYPSTQEFFEKVNSPKGLEVRYESGVEEEAALALITLVETADTKGRWKKLTVGSTTPNFISVFVPRGG
jgi:hypothetical protein